MTFPSDRSCLLIIDMLNDFVDEKGALYVPGGRSIVGPIKEKIFIFKEKRLPVFYLCDSHDQNDPEFSLWPPHAVKGTWGGEVIPEIAPGEEDIVISKTKYSGFFGTNLNDLLREKNIKDLYLTGLLTDVCVFFTAHDAYNLGYTIFVFSDSTVSLDEKTKNEFLERMTKLFGAKVL